MEGIVLTAFLYMWFIFSFSLFHFIHSKCSVFIPILIVGTDRFWRF